MADQAPAEHVRVGAGQGEPGMADRCQCCGQTLPTAASGTVRDAYRSTATGTHDAHARETHWLDAAAIDCFNLAHVEAERRREAQVDVPLVVLAMTRSTSGAAAFGAAGLDPIALEATIVSDLPLRGTSRGSPRASPDVRRLLDLARVMARAAGRDTTAIADLVAVVVRDRNAFGCRAVLAQWYDRARRLHVPTDRPAARRPLDVTPAHRSDAARAEAWTNGHRLDFDTPSGDPRDGRAPRHHDHHPRRGLERDPHRDADPQRSRLPDTPRTRSPRDAWDDQHADDGRRAPDDHDHDDRRANSGWTNRAGRAERGRSGRLRRIRWTSNAPRNDRPHRDDELHDLRRQLDRQDTLLSALLRHLAGPATDGGTIRPQSTHAVDRTAPKSPAATVPVPPPPSPHLAAGPPPPQTPRPPPTEDLPDEIEPEDLDGDPEQDGTRHYYLALDDEIVRAPSIGPRTAARLHPHGITHVKHLLACDPERLSARLGARHLTASRIAAWKDQARLVCTIPWLRGTHAQLLVGAGYGSIEKILATDRPVVCAAVMQYATTRDGQNILRAGPPPEIDKIMRWIEHTQLAEPQRAQIGRSLN